jgi:hypothetical protein
MIQVRPALRSRTILILQFSLEACISGCVQDNDQRERERAREREREGVSVS